MKISVYNSLPRQPDEEIRWPGVESLGHEFACRGFAAVSVLLREETSKAAVEAYSMFLAGCDSHDQGDLDIRKYDNEGPGHSKRFLISRLLLRMWARLLHGDRISIVLSDEPHARSRVRSYRGLMCTECRTAATRFDQLEIDVDPRSSFLVNRIQIGSKAPASCLIPLGDTFRAFGVYDWPEPQEPHSFLTRISSCYKEQRGLWRWDPEQLLPVVCAGSTSFFFLQGVANETTLQMIVYLPAEQLQTHLEIAKTRFAAELSIAVQ